MNLANSTEDNFEVACSFLGWGDPGSVESPGIWFIGIEEGQAWTEETIALLRGHEFDLVTDPKVNVFPVADWTSKIVCGFSARFAERDWHQAWKEYRHAILWQSGCRVA
jgi:hypothetical protein